jgi:NADH-quinone oxidoreductase subunit G
MSAQPSGQSAPDLVHIEIDGKALQAPKGAMIIQVADQAGIRIPRFCYHEKLAIAANCRMCLVDVEKTPKPLPACATPVMEGMKVYTRSKRALDAQRNVMEFLLINHPLDCPICDQGGECELQDVAMGYGRSVSRFTERKRVVPDEDLGPLVATEMTRCIHCTRCVRFMDDIAGTNELGGMFRGEHLEIGTWIGRSLRSELSGNIIDLCPVGALTNKVFRFRARPWELIAREGIGYHDSIGSNLYLHLRRGEVLRTVPRDNEAINENWLSDRDRFSHQALGHSDRITRPRVRRDGAWQEIEWEEALQLAADGLRQAIATHGGDGLGVLATPMASAEELFLLQAMTRGLGSPHIDHRLQQLDFSDDPARPLAPGLGAPLAEYPATRAILLVGADPRHDAPILGHRIRRAWRNGATIHAVNPLGFEHHFQLAHELIGDPAAQLADLAAIARAIAAQRAIALPEEFAAIEPTAEAAATAIARSLLESEPSRVLFGDHAARHPAASLLRRLAVWIAEHSGSVFDELPAGANGAAAWRVGCVPHRGPAGQQTAHGLNARAMLSSPRPAYVLFGADVPADFADGAAVEQALAQAGFVLAVSAFSTPSLEQHASLILPLALPPESEGSWVNAEGIVQTLAAAAKPPGAARAGWRILRMLGHALGLAGFDFIDFTALANQVRPLLSGGAIDHPAPPARAPALVAPGAGFIVQRHVPIYAVDAVVRRAAALQATVLAKQSMLALHPEDALALGVGSSGKVIVGGREYDCAASVAVPRGVCYVRSGCAETAELPVTGQRIQLTGVSHG